ncbi:polypyrimidine tract-binding protein homolog 1-like isoform X2 [Abrus precatorius]|uniref:Polypyrimidine tract-binding protein homolog 1-like isoform X2 n=1 Tax=Abrus precatorius TaxID=3816 RepID=A0A8B8LV00_ABRPR|nr:polypyrimidine tract-binding protein homolog 1-like isoform X2 [Abrus precatorius]
MSTSNQQQFRYTQTPSKVLHFRNLPWECTDDELVDLCSPFGKVVNTKCNVGANRNQAFVEFVDLNQAISMVSYYASSSEPAQIRGKTVYIQYSNRHEIVNNKGPGDVPGNVLLVTIEGVEAGDVSIDVIHLVFSAFGFVHKIATFEKTAGFQALIQFTDAETASSARNALDGRSIPRYLLPEHVGSCHLRISYSAHKDLNIKFQSNRSRDYTNPMLPVNQTAIDTALQPVIGPDGKKKEPESNVLLASIENMQYAVTVDVLHTMSQQQQLPKKLWRGIAYMMVAIAFSDKSRDYTVLDPSLLAAHASATAWQNPQAAPMYPGSAPASQAQVPGGQIPPWNPTQQEVRPNYGSVAGTFPDQTYALPPIPGYAPAATPATATSPLAPSNPIVHNESFMGITQPGVPLNVNLQSSGASPPVPGSSPHMQARPFPHGSSPGPQPYYG